MTPIKEKIQAPYKFTERETCELARKLAQANQRMTELEDQKKSVTSDFKARLDREQAEASLLAQHISQGYEMRETDVNVTLFPKDGTKHYHNTKTGEFIREERMTQADYQIEMRFEQARAEEARKKAAEQPPAAAVVEPTPEPLPVAVPTTPAAPPSTEAQDDIPMSYPPTQSQCQPIAPPAKTVPMPRPEPPRASQSPKAPLLPVKTIEQLQSVIGPHKAAAEEWMRRNGWLAEGQELERLSPDKAAKVVGKPTQFLRAIGIREAA